MGVAQGPCLQFGWLILVGGALLGRARGTHFRLRGLRRGHVIAGASRTTRLLRRRDRLAGAGNGARIRGRVGLERVVVVAAAEHLALLALQLDQSGRDGRGVLGILRVTRDSGGGLRLGRRVAAGTVLRRSGGLAAPVTGLQRVVRSKFGRGVVESVLGRTILPRASSHPTLQPAPAPVRLVAFALDVHLRGAAVTLWPPLWDAQQT